MGNNGFSGERELKRGSETHEKSEGANTKKCFKLVSEQPSSFSPCVVVQLLSVCFWCLSHTLMPFSVWCFWCYFIYYYCLFCLFRFFVFQWNFVYFCVSPVSPSKRKVNKWSEAWKKFNYRVCERFGTTKKQQRM